MSLSRKQALVDTIRLRPARASATSPEGHRLRHLRPRKLRAFQEKERDLVVEARRFILAVFLSVASIPIIAEPTVGWIGFLPALVWLSLGAFVFLVLRSTVLRDWLGNAALSRRGPRRPASGLCRRGQTVHARGFGAAIVKGAAERVRPKMMTVTAISAGLLPIRWNDGTGSEVMQRIAVPMIGGMANSTVLTLLVIPAIYGLVKDRAAADERDIVEARRFRIVEVMERSAPWYAPRQ